jgi:protein phosphatase 1G
VPNKEKHSIDGENEFLKFGKSDMQGWRKRQEDAHVAAISLGDKKNIDVFGVFDGHGGKEVSQFVSNHFTKELVSNKNIEENMPQALKETFIKMDEIMITDDGIEEIKKYARKSKEEDDIQSKKEPPNSQMQLIAQLLEPKNPESNEISMRTGCTACVMGVDETKKKLYFANAGDSRVVMCKKGVAYAQSEDHKPDMKSEKDRIYNAEGWISDGRVKGNLNLTRGFGDLEYKQNKNLKPEEQMITANPDIKEVNFEDDIEFVIIGCDGIWDCLKNQEACDFVSKRLKENPDIKVSKIVEEMMDSIIAKDLYSQSGIGCDNMTCIVIVFKKK